ncbi:diphosphomevalonate decarboxylase [Fundicoccus culcitae]|uniref:diphosphomevalonate decarboxylase n=1 Tax=Fundicoccus culcitae TaxID=2969821 RepID=A0ABY5P2G1_9LACT|nr:diphosphomevalonate decarboxylase [Fundicoccus culcitae]UUX32791.1 diphosphomevalonate decarboxylase [Fundicoccus culcitae]
MNSLFKSSYRAFTNIALIKYWGKRHEDLFLPLTSSLSLTLDAFYTDTTVEFKPNAKADVFILDGVQQGVELTQKVSQFVDLFRETAGMNMPVTVTSINHVPTAAGLASSASAFAALASACNGALGLGLDNRALSIYARQGSGSATRSLFGGFVVWHKGEGEDSQSSYAEAIDDAEWDIGMLVVIINQQQKKISSRVGMAHTRDTSPFYAMWPSEVEKDLAAIIPAIEAHDFETVGEIAEHNAMKMHASILASNPSFTYFEPDSLVAMAIVKELREQGIACYVTMDAGPNVKVIGRLSEMDQIIARFKHDFKADQLIVAKPGSAPIELKA